jgi:hypothetical protein
MLPPDPVVPALVDIDPPEPPLLPPEVWIYPPSPLEVADTSIYPDVLPEKESILT